MVRKYANSQHAVNKTLNAVGLGFFSKMGLQVFAIPSVLYRQCCGIVELPAHVKGDRSQSTSGHETRYAEELRRGGSRKL